MKLAQLILVLGLRFPPVGSRVFPRWSIALVVTLAPGNRG
jgi:hypothetical protein